MVIMMPVAVVHEEMHCGAGQKEKIGSQSKNMSPMLARRVEQQSRQNGNREHERHIAGF
ncbi:hypothetical protein GCM10019071_25470 [Sphingobium fuliginis]|uniref:Uncharacterized protein n=1 Tax=Sphingobium fuliginis (strain ATCC 27551) TaxID=336203 RepID=A0ABQ1F0A9_SPHSA|nr:hypothetical protein GCM10019071_25470 [Sphingobium fuliginis]